MLGNAECDRKFWKGSKGMQWLLCWLWRMDLVETKGGGDLASESNLLFRQATFKVRAKFIYLHSLLKNLVMEIQFTVHQINPSKM